MDCGSIRCGIFRRHHIDSCQVQIKTTDSDMATALRTCVVLVFAWIMAALAGPLSAIGSISGKSWLFLALSGLATGASWLCYYYAIAAGQVSVVVQIDKLSILISVLFAFLVFHEKLTPRGLAGLALIVAGTAAMAWWV